MIRIEPIEVEEASVPALVALNVVAWAAAAGAAGCGRCVAGA